MANQAAKKRAAINKRECTKLIGITSASMGVFAIWIIFWWQSIGWLYVLLSVSNMSLVGGLFYVLYTAARPTYDAHGELTNNGGADLSLKGITEYEFDLFYVGVFVQVTTIILSRIFWLTWIPVIGYAGFRVWTELLSPLLATYRASQPASSGPTGPMSNRQKKLLERQNKEKERSKKRHH
ncbi:SRP-independent targeting protein 2 [Pelomyxa schiedti]|nr:SRP-independent targeting protein 2 [Pelomyxa schiedti]